MSGGKIFRIEVRSAFAEWDRYAVYMTAACFGDRGEMVDYVNLTDKNTILETPPCNRVDLYLYVIAREFPASDLISASPPFEIELVTSANNGVATVTTYLVNQWGGLSVKQALV